MNDRHIDTDTDNSHTQIQRCRCMQVFLFVRVGLVFICTSYVSVIQTQAPPYCAAQIVYIPKIVFENIRNETFCKKKNKIYGEQQQNMT